MTTLRKAAEQALEALEHGWIEKGDAVANALRAALAAEPARIERVMALADEYAVANDMHTFHAARAALLAELENVK